MLRDEVNPKTIFTFRAGESVNENYDKVSFENYFGQYPLIKLKLIGNNFYKIHVHALK